MCEVLLKFNKSETRLAGFPCGEEVFNTQARGLIYKDGVLDDHIVVVFPNQIEKVASSFVQGFFAELINTIGYDEILKRFEIKASSVELVQNIYGKIL